MLTVTQLTIFTHHPFSCTFTIKSRKSNFVLLTYSILLISLKILVQNSTWFDATSRILISQRLYTIQGKCCILSYSVMTCWPASICTVNIHVIYQICIQHKVSYIYVTCPLMLMRCTILLFHSYLLTYTPDKIVSITCWITSHYPPPPQHKRALKSDNSRVYPK